MLIQRATFYRAIRGRDPVLACARAALIGIGLGVIGVAQAGAEMISVGPTANGCDFADLASAFGRAAMTTESDIISVTSDVSHNGPMPITMTGEADVELRGALSCANPGAAQRTISSTAGDLFVLDNTTLFVENLDIVNTAPSGRLIDASGSIGVILNRSLLDGGQAGDGANVRIADGATLVLDPGSRIRNGIATNLGGGIACSGGGQITLEDGSRVDGNQALLGGGIFASGCVVEVFAGGPAPGGGTFGVSNNQAIAGGGLYLEGSASLLMVGNDENPASVADNEATTGNGGGIVIQSGVDAELLNTEIVRNRAGLSGGGIFVNSGGELLMDRTTAACNRAQRCSLLAGNEAGQASGSDGWGGGIAVEFGAMAHLRQTMITDNAADDGSATYTDSMATLLLEGCVLFDNQAAKATIFAENSAVVGIAFVSAWGSSEAGVESSFARATTGAQIFLRSSLIIEGQGDAPGGGGGVDPVFEAPTGGAAYFASCVLAHETTSFPAGSAEVGTVTDPAAMWVSPTAGDPHLLAAAPAIDICDTTDFAPSDSDIDGETRGSDVVSIPNGLGPYDLGADEWSNTPISNTIFADGFEAGSTVVWSATVPPG